MVLCWALLFESFSGGSDVCLFLSLELTTRCCLFSVGLCCVLLFIFLWVFRTLLCSIGTSFRLCVGACVCCFVQPGWNAHLTTICCVCCTGPLRIVFVGENILSGSYAALFFCCVLVVSTLHICCVDYLLCIYWCSERVMWAV